MRTDNKIQGSANMNINKLQNVIYGFFDKPEHQTVQQANRQEPAITDADSAETSRSKDLKGTVTEGLQNLSPFEQYSYMASQGNLNKPASLKMIPGNPQKTVSLANKVINEAIMPPAVNNPNRQLLSEAIQLKRFAQNRLDKAA
jgi:hypothetical protein